MLSSKKAASPFVNDSFSQRWANVIQRGKKKSVFRKKSDHIEIVKEFETLIAERKQNDDLPYAALVCLSLARYLESFYGSDTNYQINISQASIYLESSEYFWEAAHDDKVHGCTDPPEVLRLHARDAQARALLWFEKAGDEWMQSEIFLKSALHLRDLEEYDEAGYFAEQCAGVEKSLGNLHDVFVAYGVAAHCYALNRNYVDLGKALESMLMVAKNAVQDDKFPGFTFAPAKVGWQTAWSELAILNVTVALFLFNVIVGRNTKMGHLLEKDLKDILMIKDGKLGELWDSLCLIVEVKRAEREVSVENIEKCKFIILQYVREEEVVKVLMEQVSSLLTKLPNWEWNVEKN